MTLREAVFDRDVLAFDVPGFFQALAECGQKVWVIAGRPAVEETDYRHCRLLCASSKWHEEETTRNTADERSSIQHSIAPRTTESPPILRLQGGLDVD
jgi:hypothetical protein